MRLELKDIEIKEFCIELAYSGMHQDVKFRTVLERCTPVAEIPLLLKES